MKQLFKAVIISGAFLLYAGCSKDSSDNTDNTAANERTAAVKDYNEMYLTTNVTLSELAWTGNTANCDEGSISQAALDKCIKRLNYFRKICGLSYNLTLNTSWLPLNQKAALMMSANNALSHNPPTTWKCYSTEGASTAGKSNIALGLHSSNAVTAWIQDYGTGNQMAGHRRWILFSRAVQFGIGSTSNAATMYCIDDAHIGDPLPAGSPEYVAYPPKYIPQGLLYPRWSFSVLNSKSYYSGVDFTSSTVKVTAPDGTSLPVSIISYKDNGYGDQTIVWEPTGYISNSSGDLKYHVTIDKVVVNGVTKKYEYDVNVIKP